ncbi:hypothetical protein [Nioella nitratireducens]|uniref:hypothetical protein n=1 Tax=Nioella nitratireducens TaxID=1287720 RepID=UPI0008FCE218|nr:hypothetical protein [Nioella nitratireducens]
MFDLDHPFFRPLWIRIAVVAVCGGWGLFELSNDATGWAFVFLGLGAYAAYGFFVTFDPRDDE